MSRRSTRQLGVTDNRGKRAIANAAASVPINPSASNIPGQTPDPSNIMLVKNAKKRKTGDPEWTELDISIKDELPILWIGSNAPKPSASNVTVATNTKAVRKTKANKLSEIPEDYPIRATSAWKIGAHVSAAGGVENAILNAAKIGANAFALFLKSQRKWTGPAISSQSEKAFKSRLKSFGYEPTCVLPHGSYLINLGNPDAEKREKSYECFLDELKRCEQLGLHLYNFHPGSSVGSSPEESQRYIAESINRAHKETSSIICVLENMAGAGNVVGSKFVELADIIRQVDDKSRVAVCVDTCHAFAAGYDIRTLEGWNTMMTEFDEKIGLKYLRGMHINDSQAALGSKKDRHDNVGIGQLGINAFKHIVTDIRTQGIPLVLETPNYDSDEQVWTAEISALNALSASASSNLPMTEDQIQEHVEGIRTIVKKVKGDSDDKKAKKKSGKVAETKKGPVQKAAATVRKRKRKAESEDEESELSEAESDS